MEMYDIIIRPLITEKITGLTETGNQYGFIVNRRANKVEIKKAIEELYKVSVDHVKTFNTSKNQKRAYIKFSDKNPAIDIATQLGLM